MACLSVRFMVCALRFLLHHVNCIPNPAQRCNGECPLLGVAGHGFRVAKCPLMTQSGHGPFQCAGLNRYDVLS